MSRGVGLATVHALRDEGVAVVGAARTITPELLASGAVPVAVDLSTEVGGTLLIDRALAELGGVDLVVNNVGGGEVDLGGFLDLSEQALARPLRHQPVRSPAREPGGVADPHPAGRRDRQRLLDRRLAAGRTAVGVQRR